MIRVVSAALISLFICMSCLFGCLKRIVDAKVLKGVFLFLVLCVYLTS